MKNLFRLIGFLVISAVYAAIALAGVYMILVGLRVVGLGLPRGFWFAVIGALMFIMASFCFGLVISAARSGSR